MTFHPVIAQERASQLRTLAVALLVVTGLTAAAVIAVWEPVADLLGEGAIRLIDVDGSTRRVLIVAILAGATLIVGYSLWRWQGMASYFAAGIAALWAVFAAGPFALPMITLAIAAVAVERIAPIERARLPEVGPCAHPLAWGGGAVVVAAFLAVSAYLIVFLVSPLIDKGTELDEALAFSFATPAATSAPEGTGTVAPADATAAPTEAPAASEQTATLISEGELMGTDSFHFGSGQVLLIRDPDGSGVLRFENYEVRNGPEIHVFMTPDPGGDVHVDGAIDLGEVRATSGNVNYELPAGADLESFRSVVIYCVPFRVVFASAELN